MSPKKSGVASPVESSDQKIEKVLEFHESARFSIKIFFVKISDWNWVVSSRVPEGLLGCAWDGRHQHWFVVSLRWGFIWGH